MANLDKWIVGLGQVTADMLAGQTIDADTLETYADRINGYVAEMQAIQDGEGTDAHEMLAAVELANVETTETLMGMLAGTVLAQLIDEEGGGRSNITYSPEAMDSMMKRYELDVTRDGMLTTVRINPREGAFPGLAIQIESGEDAKPQAEAKVHDRPVWAIRYYASHGGPYLAKMHDEGDAERHLLDYTGSYDSPEPTIENRFCLHPECPTTGCLHKADEEVTSAS